MTGKLFGRRIPPACEYCEHGNMQSGSLTCRGKPVEPRHSCLRYRYDPFKRVPKRAPAAAKPFRPEDFSLTLSAQDEEAPHPTQE